MIEPSAEPLPTPPLNQSFFCFFFVHKKEVLTFLNFFNADEPAMTFLSSVAGFLEHRRRDSELIGC